MVHISKRPDISEWIVLKCKEALEEKQRKKERKKEEEEEEEEGIYTDSLSYPITYFLLSLAEREKKKMKINHMKKRKME